MLERQPSGEFAAIAAKESAMNDFNENYKGNVGSDTYLRNGYDVAGMETAEDAAEELETLINDDNVADIATDPDKLEISYKKFDPYTPAELKAVNCTLYKIQEGDPQGIRKAIDDMYRSAHAVFFTRDTDGTLIIAEHSTSRNILEKHLKNPELGA